MPQKFGIILDKQKIQIEAAVVKWNEHFTESAIVQLRQCCIYKVGNPLVESSGFYIEVID